MKLSWIPNTLSFGNFFCGFLSIISSAVASFSIEQHPYFVYSTIFILMAAVLDVLDGRIARRINQPNPLGKDLDSFADLVTFGLAPAFMFFFMFFGNAPFYESPLSEYYVVGSLLSFLFPFFAALRLARFNVTDTSNAFFGVPSPIAGGSIVVILCFPELPDIVPSLFDVTIVSFLNIETFYTTVGFPWWFVAFMFVFYAFLMGSKFVFVKISPNFMNFSRTNSPFRNTWSVVSLIILVIFFKYFLLLYSFYYTFKPIILFRRARSIS